jgi:DNA-binding NarL/FixJ family response regulator
VQREHLRSHPHLRSARDHAHGEEAVLNQHSAATSRRILIVGYDCILRKGLATILCSVVPRAAFEEASCFEDAKERLEREDFYAAIFNVDVGDRNKPGNFETLRAEHPRLILGVISWIDSASVILSYLAAGVTGYILGYSSQSEIECAIRAILRGAIYVPPSLVESEAGQPDLEPAATPLCRHLKGVTRRQSAVLDLLLTGCSNKQIARDLGLSPHTVKIHVGALLRHFAVRRRADLAIAVRRSTASTHCNALSSPTEAPALN